MAPASGSALRALAIVLALSCGPLAAGPAHSADTGDRLLVREGMLGAGSLFPLPGNPRAFAGFLQVTALAGEGQTLFVADTGGRTIYRVDLASRQLAPIYGARGAAPRIRSGSAGSWYLLQGDPQQVLELGPDGARRARYSSIEFTRAVDAMRVPGGGLTWVFEFSGGIHEFSPNGVWHRALRALDERGATIQAAVAGPESTFVLDRSCECVIEIDSNGLPLRLIASGELALANDLAVDRYGRVWLTTYDRSTLLFIPGDGDARPIDLGSIGVNQVSALTIVDDRLFLADPTSGQISVFGLLPPRAGEAH